MSPFPIYRILLYNNIVTNKAPRNKLELMSINLMAQYCEYKRKVIYFKYGNEIYFT